MKRLAALLLLIVSANVVASPLVDSAWLQANIDQPEVKLIEVSVDPQLFDMGHIPSAQMLNWHTDLSDPVRRDIASREALQEKLRAIGINAGDTVVLYGDNNNWFAAWGFWLLDGYGVKSVKLLDGGRVKWEAQGLPLTRQVSQPDIGNVSLSAFNNRQRARLSDVLAVAEQRQPGQLIDIRSPAEYQGAITAPEGSGENAQRAGHIPTAINVPWQSVVNADGTFKSVEQLRALYREMGVDTNQPLITYCRIGERSAHSWFVLSQLLGLEASNYDGSWTEWGNSVGLPISRPVQP